MGPPTPDLVPVVREWIGNDEVGIVVGAFTVVDKDGDVARARARAEVARYLPVVGHRDPTFEGREPPLDRVTIAGTPEEVIAHAERLFAAGVKRIDFGAQHGVELLAERVAPYFSS